MVDFMDSGERVIAKECIKALLDLPDEWKSVSEFPQTAAAEFLSVLVVCGFCEVMKECTIRLMDGSDKIITVSSYGLPSESEGKLPLALELLLAERVPNRDTDVACEVKDLCIRPTFVGNVFRNEHSAVDEAGIAMFVDALQHPPEQAFSPTAGLHGDNQYRDNLNAASLPGICQPQTTFFDTVYYDHTIAILLQRNVGGISRIAKIENEEQMVLLRALIKAKGELSRDEAVRLVPHDRDNVRRRLIDHLEKIGLTLETRKWHVSEVHYD
ncbi:MAG: hypothetical protein RIK87_11920 [Fuerstiella sp.]